MHVCIYTCVQVPTKAGKRIGSPGAGVTVDCEMLIMGTGN